MDLWKVFCIFSISGVYLTISRSIFKAQRRSNLSENSVSFETLHDLNNIAKLDKHAEVLEDLSRGKGKNVFVQFLKL